MLTAVVLLRTIRLICSCHRAVAVLWRAGLATSRSTFAIVAAATRALKFGHITIQKYWLASMMDPRRSKDLKIPSKGCGSNLEVSRSNTIL